MILRIIKKEEFNQNQNMCFDLFRFVDFFFFFLKTSDYLSLLAILQLFYSLLNVEG